jgi:ABC-type amino acid transport substrate-binding protein
MGRFGKITALVLVTASLHAADKRTIVYEKGTDSYEISVLDQALGRTVAEYGPYQLQSLAERLSETRSITLLNQGGFDVTYMVLTPERESQVLPIRVDLSRGTQGYRLILTRQDIAADVARVTSLEELRRRFTLGFGSQWSDLSIFTNAGFRVVTATDPRLLYPMLDKGRFDVFPRGLNEVWGNLEDNRQAAPHLVVADRVALLYPLVNCFVVARTNTELAGRLNLGLGRLLADGSLRRLFNAYYGADLKRAGLDGRTVFVLPNPEFPRGGPAFDTSWWLPER